ncbi:hypothetical protein ACERIT_04895 [Halopenitus sp. H-Gu1]|uniref:hypothetical protein n=1 Tax=Halopenitus sp. H-Gu1 TaxID=3242697 RepID=UPI00359E4AF8
MKRSVIALIILVGVVALGLAASGAFTETADGPGAGPIEEPPTDDRSVPEVQLLSIDGAYALWPYTSSSESIEGRTLAINVVFEDDPETVFAALQADSEADWTESSESGTTGSDSNATTDGIHASEVNTSDVDADFVEEVVTTDWQRAHGSTRYVYFEREDGEGVWVDETYQLHAGTYLGTRYHIRAYGSPDGSYTAVQAHGEYYDWFRLRHTVTDVSESARTIEDDFIGSGADVRREYRGIEGGRSDGWISVIELVAFLPLAAAILRRETRRSIYGTLSRLRADAVRHRDAVLLGVGLAAVYLGVRAAGIAFETGPLAIPPKLIAGPLYLLIAIGLPLLTWRVAARCDRVTAFLGAAVGLGGGFLIDFATLGVSVPPDLIAHRIAVLAAIGIVAAGRATNDRSPLAENGTAIVGLVAWALVLALPLAGVV